MNAANLSLISASVVVACGCAPSPPSQAANAKAAPTSRGLGLKGAMYGDSIGGPIDPSRVKGRLPPEVIQKVVRDNFGGMRKCYEDGLRTDAKLKGKITTRFVIERDGHVSSAADIHDAPAPGPLEKEILPQPKDPRFPDAAVVDCVVGRFAALTFPQPQGGIVTVVYPIIFSPEE